MIERPERLLPEAGGRRSFYYTGIVSCKAKTLQEGEKKMKTDGIILDVDGTLWDSTPIVAGAWTRAVQ